MHEQALVRDLLREAERLAAQHPDGRVRRVDIWVGALSHLSPDGLQVLWAELGRGTAVGAATLSVELSHDRADPRAQGIVLTRLIVEDADVPGPIAARPRPAPPSVDMPRRRAE